MVYTPSIDFVGLWRNSGGNVTKLEMPGLDFVVAALARAGVINLVVSATAPVVNQSTTAWLQAAVPSYSAEGVLHLWNPVTSAYAAATPALFLDLLQASANQSGASWWTSTGGPPANTVGNNGDFAVRLDEPCGIYGPKALGAWPVTPVPGTADVLTSTALDNTFGTSEGELIYRGPSVWQSLPIGPANSLLVSTGVLPTWEALSALLDAVFGSAQGDILYRDVGLWMTLAPGTPGQILATSGASANPVWSPRTAEFPSGTIMVFQQSAAPPGWTKQTSINDYGLRVTSGAVGVTPGTPFSTVFAQTAVGNTTLTTTTMPNHNHPLSDLDSPSTLLTGLAGAGNFASGPFATADTASILVLGATGGGAAHGHSVQLALSYIDVIIAQKN